ncbi:hypothetical protein RU07_13840 [Agrobacterium tumefaciens]|uniref:Uncharacterized protein n=1 Tax=Agrobacterium tumefaciens TaxID=358 RepID=A0A0D0KU71_AGRTU|nr:hypothetical protein RU07_13840 [Agrobacterium tumefaciens]
MVTLQFSMGPSAVFDQSKRWMTSAASPLSGKQDGREEPAGIQNSRRKNAIRLLKVFSFTSQRKFLT